MSFSVSLQHRYAGFTLDASFDVPAQGVTVLFGPSGSGKSTILACIAGLLSAQAGRIALGGEVLFDRARNIDVAAEARRAAVVFQDARLFPHMTVRNNLLYGFRRSEGDAHDFATVTDMLGVAHLLDRRPATLSGGERQRVALGRALLARPHLLLMDEPLAALDAPRKQEILPFLERVRDTARVPIVYVTHALDEVDRLADTLVLLEQGKVLAAGSLHELSARTDLPLLSDRRDAGVVLSCTVDSSDAGQTRLQFDGGMLIVPPWSGVRPRVRIRARDVAIATEQPVGLSIRNVLPARVTAIAPHDDHECFVNLQLGGTFLLARVSRSAVVELGLAPGRDVWALIKSVALS
ncbi:molybdenum ABC transporter ATP-binding protein [Roseiterribacter gracilis]|uniref:Molybdenum import ATP-binding protein ModC n=1 Tax=Roseiterribacter gracilis TaxID=2812848 RepID=A0A8S8XKM1_9PROT|nr:molybdenum import ATP-binding protein ModC [Rhodospirillales bacterium TMPK1]